MVTGAPDDLDRALRILTAFFHTLRDNITAEESMHFVAQLPMLLKAIYVDGWKLAHKSGGGHTLAAFLDEVRIKCGTSAGSDLGSDHRAAITLQNVLGVLRNYISEGELEDIRAQLPEEIASLFERIEVL